MPLGSCLMAILSILQLLYWHRNDAWLKIKKLINVATGEFKKYNRSTFNKTYFVWIRNEIDK